MKILHGFPRNALGTYKQNATVLWLRRAGPTVILDQHFDVECGRASPEQPEGCALVFPRMNNFCIFDGCLGHGVLDAPAQQRRITLLINWWAEQPQDVFPISIQGIPEGVRPQLVGEGQTCNWLCDGHQSGQEGPRVLRSRRPALQAHQDPDDINQDEGCPDRQLPIHVINLDMQDDDSPGAIMVRSALTFSLPAPAQCMQYVAEHSKLE